MWGCGYAYMRLCLFEGLYSVMWLFGYVCMYADMRLCCFWVLTFAYVDLAICINDGRVLFL